MKSYSERAREITLASVLAAYPDEDAALLLAELGPALDRYPVAAAVAKAIDESLDDLRSRYLEIFERGGRRASLYETEYGRMRGMSKGNDLADIAGFYNAFGVRLDDDAHESVDHIAIELEFYAMMLLKQEVLADDAEGTEVVLDARKKFLRDHLGGFVRALATRPDVASDPIYGPVFAWIAELVDAECVGAGVEPASLDYFADPDDRKEMKCGSVHLPVVS